MLNETAEKLAVAVYDPSLDGRFENLSLGNVSRRNKSCQHAQNFSVYDPLPGSVCVWSCLMSIVTGARDPRWIEDTFEANTLPCHTSMDVSMNLIMTFSQMSNVSNFQYILNNQFTIIHSRLPLMCIELLTRAALSGVAKMVSSL